ncbi:WD repeat-containing protein 60 [Branchiostoma belcheri]|nr:WD repeat-containing protein 60 [Branchiostoma belcheri]
MPSSSSNRDRKPRSKEDTWKADELQQSLKEAKRDRRSKDGERDNREKRSSRNHDNDDDRRRKHRSEEPRDEEDRHRKHRSKEHRSRDGQEEDRTRRHREDGEDRHRKHRSKEEREEEERPRKHRSKDERGDEDERHRKHRSKEERGADREERKHRSKEDREDRDDRKHRSKEDREDRKHRSKDEDDDRRRKHKDRDEDRERRRKERKDRERDGSRDGSRHGSEDGRDRRKEHRSKEHREKKHRDKEHRRRDREEEGEDGEREREKERERRHKDRKSKEERRDKDESESRPREDRHQGRRREEVAAPEQERPSEVRAIMEAMNQENATISPAPFAGLDDGKDSSGAYSDSSTSNSRPTTGKGRTFINFVAAKQRQVSRKVATKTTKRGKELMRLLELDFVGHDILDIPPLTEYELYIRSFGSSNTQQAYTQCGDDNIDREVQTEEVEISQKWTQHPSTQVNACGDDSSISGADQDQETKAVDTVKLTNFLNRSCQVVAVLLEEDLASRTAEPKRSTHSNMAFSDNMVTLATSQLLLAGDDGSYAAGGTILPPREFCRGETV